MSSLSLKAYTACLQCSKVYPDKQFNTNTLACTALILHDIFGVWEALVTVPFLVNPVATGRPESLGLRVECFATEGFGLKVGLRV